MGQVIKKDGPPTVVLLQCYFDKAALKKFTDDRLELRVQWERNSAGEYERTEFFFQTAYGRQIARTKRDNCPSSTCKLKFDLLSLPKSKDDKLSFDFTVALPVVDNSDKFLFDSKLRFWGDAYFLKSI